jgi:Lipocalin-like domain
VTSTLAYAVPVEKHTVEVIGHCANHPGDACSMSAFGFSKIFLAQSAKEATAVADHSTPGCGEIFGIWRLISFSAQGEQDQGPHFPLGEDADGFLIYTRDGYMSVQMMRRGRAFYDQPDILGGTTEQSAAAARGYVAYCGPFEIDASGLVHHLVVVSLLPNWLEGVQLRRPDLKGDHLTMHAQYQVDTATVTSILRWKRVTAHDARPLFPH